jgi:signal transduction histidine kinase
MATSPEPASLPQPVSPPSGKAEERLTLFNRILTFLAPPLQTELLPSTELTPLLAQRREQILTAVLRTVAVLGLLIIFAFLPDFIQELMIYLACLALVWLVAWKRQLNYRFRAGLFLAIEYSLAVLDFLAFGLTPEGTTFLYSFTITAMILAGSVAGLRALGMSVASIFLVGWLILSGLWVVPPSASPIAPVTLAIVISTGLVFLMQAGLVMAALHVLLGGYRLAWQRERLAFSQLQQERDLLEYRVAERTRELSQAYEQALSASQYKTEFLARVSHELRTPLGAILGYIELMQQGLFGPLSPQQETAIQRTVDNTYYLNSLIQDLLDGAQIEREQLKIVYAPFPARKMVEETCLPLEVLAKAKQLQFTAYVDPHLPERLMSDEKRIRQILNNLANNAIKFTDEGKVEVSLQLLNEDRWAIQVSDTGPGIPQESQDTIFQPFWQIGGTNTVSGYGLGLAIVKQLATLMEGEIILDSTVSRGTSFTVMFPLEPKGNTAQPLIDSPNSR